MGAFRRLTLLAAAAALGAATSVPVSAQDRVEFLTGSSLDGEIVAETDDEVSLRADGGVVSIPRRLVARVVRGVPGESGAGRVAGTGAGGPADAPVASPATGGDSGVVAPAEEWQVLWAGDRRVGWRRCTRREDPLALVFEEETAFVGPDGAVEVRTRFLEEAHLDYRPRRFTYREDAGGRITDLRGRVDGGRLVVEESVDGRDRVREHALPPAFRLPLAARAFVLREAEGLPGGWKGTVYDPRAGGFEEQSLRIDGRERFPWEGVAVEAVVLRRRRNGVVEEERVARSGTLLTADVNGSALTAVGTTRERAEAVGAGRALDPTADEVRARTTFVAETDGFRLRKPGVAWEFEEGRAGSNPRLRVRDVAGLAFVDVFVEAEPEERSLAAAAAAVEGRFRAASAEFARVADRFDRFAGEPAYHLLCDALVKGDRVRTMVRAVQRRGRLYLVVASCPAAAWEEARPHLERVVEGFEFL